MLTTLGGLRLESMLHESNPIAAAAMEQLGTLPALLGIGAMTILVVALFTEIGVVVVRRSSGTSAADDMAVRLLGYGLASTVNLTVAIYNVVLFLSV